MANSGRSGARPLATTKADPPPLLSRARARPDPQHLAVANGVEDRSGEAAALRGHGLPAYDRCLFTSRVISNMLTLDLPPSTGRSVSSALIIRLFCVSCSPRRLM